MTATQAVRSSIFWRSSVALTTRATRDMSSGTSRAYGQARHRTGRAPRTRASFAPSTHREPGAESLRGESRDHAAVTTLVDARAVRVEVSDDRHFDAPIRVGEGDVLVERLRGRVRPSMNGCGSEDAIAVLAERDLVAAAVYLGG